MKTIPVDKLKPIPSLPSPMLHKSGTPLLTPGEELTDMVIDKIKASGLNEVFFPDPSERLDEIRRTMTHTPVAVSELEAGDTLTRTVYDDNGHLLLEAGTAIPKNFQSSLTRRNIQTIYFRKPEDEVDAKGGRELRTNIEKLLKGEIPIADEETVQSIQKVELAEAKSEDLDPSKFEAKLNRLKSIDVKPTGEAFAEQVRDTRDLGPVSKEEKAAFSGSVNSSLENVREVFDVIQNGNARASLELVDEVATQALAGTIRHRELMMHCGTAKNNQEYVVSHALAMTVLAVNIGTIMKFGTAQIKSLAYGAMLADVGMLKVPEEILGKSERLTPGEHAEIRRHPAHGLDMLQKIQRIPAEVPYIVYQSHERANGSGYPCGKKDVVIHAFAKIVSISDIFSSVCSHRPYREAKTPYEAMEQLVLMCGKRLINPEVVKSFLKCNSMFPVGSFVRLSDKRAARVVAANPEDYMRPCVSVIADEANNLLSEPERVNLLQNKELTVTQALLEKDMPELPDPMYGF